MLIQIRGPWRKPTKAGASAQLNNIADKVGVYNTTLGIPTADKERIQGANALNLFINSSRVTFNSWVKGLTTYEDQLLDGNVLEAMNPFPVTPTLGVPPVQGKAGIWHFIENRRTIWMANDNFDDTIGDAMTILGPLQNFETDTYKPTLTVKVIPHEIIIHTDSSIIEVHNLYAAITGQPLKLVTTFRGSKFGYFRQLTAAGQAESVDLQVRGVYKNAEIGLESDTITVAYKG